MTSFSLPQTITYWTSSGIDANGDPSWNAPVNVAARWMRKDGIITGEKGTDQKFEYIVYSETLIPKRSMVVLAELVVDDDGNLVSAGRTDTPRVYTYDDLPSVVMKYRIYKYYRFNIEAQVWDRAMLHRYWLKIKGVNN